MCAELKVRLERREVAILDPGTDALFEEATRAGTETIVRRTVAVVAFASWGSPVRVAAARVRLNAITAQTNHAAFAANKFDGR